MQKLEIFLYSAAVMIYREVCTHHNDPQAEILASCTLTCETILQPLDPSRPYWNPKQSALSRSSKQQLFPIAIALLTQTLASLISGVIHSTGSN